MKKQSIIALIIAGTIGGTIITGGGITRLDYDGGKWLTNTQYTELKTEMKTNYLKDRQIPLDHYHLIVAILDKEAKSGKFKNLKDISGKITEDNLVYLMLNEL